MTTASDHPDEEPVLELDDTPAAPGDLELVRGFLSLHGHVPGSYGDVPPTPAQLKVWLRDRELIGAADQALDRDLRWALDVLEDLRTRVFENMGVLPDPAAVERLNEAARRAGLEVCFAPGGHTAFETREPGVRGAIGRILGTAFLSELDGSWEQFKECGNPKCRAVFWDRSKNRSGKWCSMASCGNRAKVRAFRERRGGGS